MSAPERIAIRPFQGDAASWDAVVRACAGSSFCHLHGWSEIMRDVMGHEVFLLAAEEGGRVEGVLPLVRVRSRLFGDFLMSQPFLNHGGAVGTPRARAALTAAARDLAVELSVDSMELRGREPVETDLPVTDRRITVTLPLPDTEEELWSGVFRAKLRSQIKRPMKEGMKFEAGPHLVEEFYDVFSRTMRDLGTPVLPRAFFDGIRTRFEDLMICGVVRHGGRAVAAGWGFLWRGEFEITWAGALRDTSRLAPNMLLYWSFMKECIERGAHTFDFGRCARGSGTHRFKRQWGGEDVDLPWIHWSPAGGAAEPPDPHAGKYRLAISAWRRLPLWATRTLGPWLARKLP